MGVQLEQALVVLVRGKLHCMALPETTRLTPQGAVMPGGRAFSTVIVVVGVQSEVLVTTKLTPHGTPIPEGRLEATVIVVVGTH